MECTEIFLSHDTNNIIHHQAQFTALEYNHNTNIRLRDNSVRDQKYFANCSVLHWKKNCIYIFKEVRYYIAVLLWSAGAECRVMQSFLTSVSVKGRHQITGQSLQEWLQAAAGWAGQWEKYKWRVWRFIAVSLDNAEGTERRWQRP